MTTERNFLEQERVKLKNSEKRLMEELALLKEHREQEGLNNEIVLNEEKERLVSSKDLLEINLQNYYKRELHSRDS